MHINKVLSLLIIVSLSFTSLVAQETIDEGYLKMEISDIKVEKPELQQIVPMMQGSTQEIYFNQTKQKVVLGLMSGMMQVQVFQDFDSDNFETYMDMMGNKIKSVMGPEQLAEQKKNAAALLANTKVIYDKEDRKDIMGYSCYKGTLKVEGDSPMNMTFYLTNEVNIPQAYVQNLSHIELEGSPLEMQISVAGMMDLTYTAVELKRELDPNFFVKPEGAYKEMTMDELKKMGLGGSLGF